MSHNAHEKASGTLLIKIENILCIRAIIGGVAATSLVLPLTHVPRYYRIYASANWVGIGSGNGLAPGRRQAITWSNSG